MCIRDRIKAFYMRLNDDGKTVAAADCLVPGIGEIIGGSQREERLELLERRMDELGMNREDYWWYLDLRRYGGTKHAGYGLGFERMIMSVSYTHLDVYKRQVCRAAAMERRCTVCGALLADTEGTENTAFDWERYQNMKEGRSV